MPWGWFGGLVVFGCIATSLYIAAVRAPRGRRATPLRWFLVTGAAALVCLTAVVAITIAPTFGVVAAGVR